MIKIIDSIMGSGKSTWMIKHINQNPRKRYLIVVPYLSEIDRYKAELNKLVLYEPKIKRGKSKYGDLLQLIKDKRNIITTHQLFLRIRTDILELLSATEYTLVIDESLAVFDQMSFPTNDLNVFKKCGILSTDTATGQLCWNEDLEPENEYDFGSLLPLKEACMLGSAYDMSFGATSNQKITHYLWCLPPDVFACFDDVYILTYLWDGSFHKVYFDMMKFKYCVYTLNNGFPTAYNNRSDEIAYKTKAKQLITIIDNHKLNAIGKKISNRHNPLSSGWYQTHRKDTCVQQLRKNVSNFFKHLTGLPAKYNMWTTFEAYEHTVKGKGYAGGTKNRCFLPVNTKGTNEYAHKTALAYTVNIFMNPTYKRFFTTRGLCVDEDTYATNEMVQWIWRSAIRNGAAITLYIPSDRMRELLLKWLEDTGENMNAKKTRQILVWDRCSPK